MLSKHFFKWGWTLKNKNVSFRILSWYIALMLNNQGSCSLMRVSFLRFTFQAMLFLTHSFLNVQYTGSFQLFLLDSQKLREYSTGCDISVLPFRLQVVFFCIVSRAWCEENWEKEMAAQNLEVFFRVTHNGLTRSLVAYLLSPLENRASFQRFVAMLNTF